MNIQKVSISFKSSLMILFNVMITGQIFTKYTHKFILTFTCFKSRIPKISSATIQTRRSENEQRIRFKKQ